MSHLWAPLCYLPACCAFPKLTEIRLTPGRDVPPPPLCTAHGTVPGKILPKRMGCWYSPGTQVRQLDFFPVCFNWECSGEIKVHVKPPKPGHQGFRLMGRTPFCNPSKTSQVLTATGHFPSFTLWGRTPQHQTLRQGSRSAGRVQKCELGAKKHQSPSQGRWSIVEQLLRAWTCRTMAGSAHKVFVSEHKNIHKMKIVI